MEKRVQGEIAVIAAALLWGFAGFFSRHLNDLGLSSLQITGCRMTVSTIVLIAFMALMSRKDFRASPRMLLVFLVFAVVRIVSDYALFSSMELVTLSVASVLQMTAPFYVMIISYLFFGERITVLKAAALLAAFLGCVLVTDVAFADKSNPLGIALGAVSGACYGCFVAGTKYSETKGCSPLCFVFYTTAFAMLMLLPFTDAPHVIGVTFSDVVPFLYVIGVGLVITLIPYSLQAWSLEYLDAGVASVLGASEAVFAALVGFFLFSESMSLLNIAGMGLVLVSIIMLNAEIIRFFARRTHRGRNRIIPACAPCHHEIRTRGIPFGREDAGRRFGIHQEPRPRCPRGRVRARCQDQAGTRPGDRSQGQGARHQAQLPCALFRELQLRQPGDQGEEPPLGRGHGQSRP